MNYSFISSFYTNLTILFIITDVQKQELISDSLKHRIKIDINNIIQ